jgi:2-iminobutanoate/2-iminopropanoate deaminase
MPRDSVKTDAAPKSALYSQAVKAAELVFVSGQAAFDPATGQLVGTNIQEQTRRCLENISAILSAADSSLEKVVSATFILRDPEDFAGMNEEWQSWFPGDGYLRCDRGRDRQGRGNRCRPQPCDDGCLAPCAVEFHHSHNMLQRREGRVRARGVTDAGD